MQCTPILKIKVCGYTTGGWLETVNAFVIIRDNLLTVRAKATMLAWYEERSTLYRSCLTNSRTVNVGAHILFYTASINQPLIQGCMESLVQYKRLLLRKHTSGLQPDERASLVQSCISLLQELQAVDPARQQRYKELCKRNSLRTYQSF